MIFFNLLGALWAIAGFGLAVGLQKMGVVPYGDNRFYVVAAIIIFTLDVGYRIAVAKKKGAAESEDGNALKADVLRHWLLGPGMGGSLMFLPAWACSILVPLWYVYIVAV